MYLLFVISICPLLILLVHTVEASVAVRELNVAWRLQMAAKVVGGSVYIMSLSVKTVWLVLVLVHWRKCWMTGGFGDERG